LAAAFHIRSDDDDDDDRLPTDLELRVLPVGDVGLGTSVAAVSDDVRLILPSPVDVRTLPGSAGGGLERMLPPPLDAAASAAVSNVGLTANGGVDSDADGGAPTAPLPMTVGRSFPAAVAVPGSRLSVTAPL
jgi:hypothetical protein